MHIGISIIEVALFLHEIEIEYSKKFKSILKGIKKGCQKKKHKRVSIKYVDRTFKPPPLHLLASLLLGVLGCEIFIQGGAI